MGGMTTLHRRAVLGAAASFALAGFPRTGAAFEPARLNDAVDRAGRFDQLHAVVIGRDGKIAVAKAFRGPSPSRAVNVKSVSKTIVASLAGAAVDRKVLSGVDLRVVEVAPGLVPADADPRVRAITIGQLLTMQAGLETTSGPGYGRWIASSNWVDYALHRPFVAEPGGRMVYSTGTYHILGAVLARAAGRSLLSLARDWLGGPLGIEVAGWGRDPQGLYVGGNNMLLSPLDLFRFGEMWRQGGVWRGSRVLSAAWTEASWVARTRSPYSGDDYGYGWFLTEIGGHRVAYARGFGGQMVYVVPSLGMTVVVTSDPSRRALSEGYVGALKVWLGDAVMPAAERA